jgi:hypothetical protein
VHVPGGLVFPGPLDGYGMELLFTEETVGGVRVAVEFVPGSEPSDPEKLLVVGKKLYFDAMDATGDRELFALPWGSPP